MMLEHANPQAFEAIASSDAWREAGGPVLETVPLEEAFIAIVRQSSGQPSAAMQAPASHT